jgi:hypothetical protein
MTAFQPTHAIEYLKKESDVSHYVEYEYDVDDLNRIMRISKPDIAESSIKTYKTNLRLFKKLYDNKFGDDHPGIVEKVPTRPGHAPEIPTYIYNFKFLIPTANYDPIRELDLYRDKNGKPMPLSTQKNYINAILPIIQSGGIIKIPNPYYNKKEYDQKTKEEKKEYRKIYGSIKPWDTVEKYYKDQNDWKKKGSIAFRIKQNENNNVISDKKKEKYEVSFQQLLDIIPKLKEDDGDFQGALLLSLMATYKIRNEVGTLRLIKLEDYVELTDKEKEDNNYVVLKDDGNMFISRGDYKTDGHWGVIISEVKDKTLKEDLTNYINDMDDDVFFKINKGKTKGTQFSREYVSKRIGRITKKHLKVELGTSSINKLFIATLDKDTINALIQLSRTRGTSIEVLISSYFNNI